MTELFCKLPHVIMVATHWISTLTGERISFTGDQKIMWVWMCSRFRFFHGKGGEWFDNQADIAAATGTSPSAVKRFVELLKTHGHITVKKRRRNGFIQSNSYTILRDLVLSSPTSECASRPLPTVAPEPVSVAEPVSVPVASEQISPDEPDERIPDYVSNVFIMPTPPKVKLTPSPAVAPEVVQPRFIMPSGPETVDWEIAVPVTHEVPKLILAHAVATGNDPVWEVRRSS